MGKSELIQEIRMALRATGARLERLTSTVAGLVELKGLDVEVLDHLGRVGPISPGELAAEMHIHPATMTGIVDRLESGGWVMRERDDRDRRKVRLGVIRNRAPELLRLYSPMNREITRICEGMTEAELATVRDFLIAIGFAAGAAVAEVD